MTKLRINYARIQKYYTTQLAALYEVDCETMYLKLRELVPVLGEKMKGKAWSPKEVVYIFYKFGTPMAKPLQRRGRIPLKKIVILLLSIFG